MIDPVELENILKTIVMPISGMMWVILCVARENYWQSLQGKDLDKDQARQVNRLLANSRMFIDCLALVFALSLIYLLRN
ncbi:MAG: hypothetical protein ACRDCE_12920 [Cetobacterium sp.]|uniref:hypothetical protein n=1 Tax=Cetobacterium sp. TaxID=2071632 RepID=UPI003EE6E765